MPRVSSIAVRLTGRWIGRRINSQLGAGRPAGRRGISINTKGDVVVEPPPPTRPGALSSEPGRVPCRGPTAPTRWVIGKKARPGGPPCHQNSKSRSAGSRRSTRGFRGHELTGRGAGGSAGSRVRAGSATAPDGAVDDGQKCRRAPPSVHGDEVTSPTSGLPGRGQPRPPAVGPLRRDVPIGAQRTGGADASALPPDVTDDHSDPYGGVSAPRRDLLRCPRQRRNATSRRRGDPTWGPSGLRAPRSWPARASSAIRAACRSRAVAAAEAIGRGSGGGR